MKKKLQRSSLRPRSFLKWELRLAYGTVPLNSERWRGAYGSPVNTSRCSFANPKSIKYTSSSSQSTSVPITKLAYQLVNNLWYYLQAWCRGGVCRLYELSLCLSAFLSIGHMQIDMSAYFSSFYGIRSHFHLWDPWRWSSACIGATARRNHRRGRSLVNHWVWVSTGTLSQVCFVTCRVFPFWARLTCSDRSHLPGITHWRIRFRAPPLVRSPFSETRTPHMGATVNMPPIPIQPLPDHCCQKNWLDCCQTTLPSQIETHSSTVHSYSRLPLGSDQTSLRIQFYNQHSKTAVR